MLLTTHMYSDVSLGGSVDAMIAKDVEAAAGSATSGGKGSSSTHASHSPSAVDASPASVACSASLSPDALMAYCESRLNSLDTQMSQIMAQQQTNQTATSAIDSVANLLNDLPGPNGDTPPTVKMTQAQWIALNQAYTAAAAACPQLKASLQSDRLTFANGNSLNTNTNEVTMSADKLTQLGQNLKNDATNLNSNSEMIMINLQSLMSQRQTAVQLTTNLVQSLGDQASSIAKNVGA